jgi:hypothetical protein
VRQVTRRSTAGAGLAAALILVLAAGGAQAQTLGIGPRMMTATGADSPIVDSSYTGATRFVGGQLRFHASRHLALELAMDYRVTLNPDETARIRSTPIQASILWFPLRLSVAPYLITGVGWYRQRIEAIDDGDSVASATTSERGYHSGVGGQVMLGKHAALFVDYRYTFVDIKGTNGLAGAAYAASSLSSVVGLLTSLGNDTLSSKVSHRGSMWTAGLTLYF